MTVFYDEKERPIVIINPGSGPVSNANELEAIKNIVKFVEDVGATDYSGPYSSEDGRWNFKIYGNNRSVEVEMPGIILSKVRYLDSENQNIWDFPRLYVDGSSWVWYFAINAAKDILFEEEEEE